MSEEIPAALDPVLSAPDSPELEDESVPEKTPPEETPEGEDKEKKEGEGEVVVPAKGSSAYDKLLAKYGGDTEKMANAIFEQYNSAARTHEELREMRAVLEELRAGKATVEETDKLVAEDPYVKEITSDIQSTNEEATVLRNEMQAMIPEYQKQQAAVARLEGALDKADDTERFELSQKVRDARDRLDRMERDYREKGREYKRLEADWKRQTRGLREAQAQARARVDAAKADAARFQQEARLSRQEFRDTLVEEAKKVGIGPDDPAFSFLHESFRARLSAHMRALQARGVTEGIDLPRAVRVLMKEYVGARPKEFAAASADKVRTATPTKPTAPAPPEKPGTKKDGEMSAAEWKARAKQLMP